MSGASITSTNRSCSGPCRRPSTGRDTTMNYTYVLNREWCAVRSRADCLLSKGQALSPAEGLPLGRNRLQAIAA